MKFRFTGTYTNGHTGISILGHSFVGREPLEVPTGAAERLSRHPEFEQVPDGADEPVTVIPAAPAVAPKRRGRPRKAH